MQSPRRALATLCLATMLLAAPAAAQPTPGDRSQAAQLKKKGDDEMESLRYAEALADYTEAYRASGDPALLYNRARVLEALERFPEAYAELERFAKEASPSLRAKVPQLRELMKDLASRITTLTIQCNVPNARVLVRDKLVATTPLDGPIRVNAGSSSIEIVAEGYVTQKQSIELPRGGALTLEVTLIARTPTGTLAVASTPSGSDVRIDGQPIGRTPAEAELAPGNHVVLLTLDGYREKKTTAVVVEGQRKEVAIDLDKNPSVFAKWWFWTAVGVVIVGGVVVTYALTTEKSAGHGDIPPGQVSGPLRVAF
ncbi:MAG TPA: PEGA domain-containing protein [Labilithrix sp.]|jgi:hypothetical protein